MREMGFLGDGDAFGYRLTLADGTQAVYADRGDCLERVEQEATR